MSFVGSLESKAEINQNDSIVCCKGRMTYVLYTNNQIHSTVGVSESTWPFLGIEFQKFGSLFFQADNVGVWHACHTC